MDSGTEMGTPGFACACFINGSNVGEGVGCWFCPADAGLTAAGTVAGAPTAFVTLAWELAVWREPDCAGADESETTLSLLQPVRPAASNNSAGKKI